MANPINDHMLVTCTHCGAVYEADEGCSCQPVTRQDVLDEWQRVKDVFNPCLDMGCGCAEECEGCPYNQE